LGDVVVCEEFDGGDLIGQRLAVVETGAGGEVVGSAVLLGSEGTIWDVRLIFIDLHSRSPGTSKSRRLQGVVADL